MFCWTTVILCHSLPSAFLVFNKKAWLVLRLAVSLCHLLNWALVGGKTSVPSDLLERYIVIGHLGFLMLMEKLGPKRELFHEYQPSLLKIWI